MEVFTIIGFIISLVFWFFIIKLLLALAKLPEKVKDLEKQVRQLESEVRKEK